MKVKIIKSNYPTYWYSHQIGNVFEVVKTFSDFGWEKVEMKKCYAVIDHPNSMCNHLIDIDDCEILTD